VHYRAFFDYAEEGLRASVEKVERLERAIRQPGSGSTAALADAGKRFDAALADDLDTPAALDALDAATELVLAGSGDSGGRDDAAVLQGMAARLGLTDAPPRGSSGS